MLIVGTKKIRSYEKGLMFKGGEFKGVLGTGRHWFFDPLNRVNINVVSQRNPWLFHPDLDLMRAGSWAWKDEKPARQR